MNVYPDMIPVPLIALVSFICSIPVLILHKNNIKMAALPIAVILIGQGLLFVVFGALDFSIEARGFVIRIGIIATSIVIAIVSILELRYGIIRNGH